LCEGFEVAVRLTARALAWLVAAAVAVAQAYAALSRPPRDRLADLHVYVGSVDLLRHGGSLYDFVAPGGAPFTYPPFAGLVLFPLGLVDEAVLRLVWTALTLAAVCGLAALTARRAGLPRPAALVGTPLVAACLFASAPVSSNLRFGQVSVFLALLVLVDLGAGAAGRLRGGLTGLAGAVKLTPLIFVPFLLVAARRRAAAVAAGVFLCCSALAWVILPGDSRRYWFTEIWSVRRVGHITTGGNQSLDGALLRLDLPAGARTAVLAAGTLAVVVLAYRRAVRAARADRWFTAVTIVGAAGVVVSPVSWTHHLVWLVLAVFLPVTGRPRYRLMWTVSALVVMIAPVTSYGARMPGLLGIVATDLRLLLAVAVACLVPFEPRAAPAAGIRPRALNPPLRTVPPPGG
jgi:alpha-1,2-mannosyltransferase